MKKTKILLAVVLALVLCLTLSLAACQCNHDYVDGVCSKCGAKDPNYVCQHNYVDGVCTKCGEKEPVVECQHNYVDGVCTKCGEKDPNYQPPKPSKAVITINPETLEVTPDDEVVLMFGVSATLDGKEVEVIIADNGGFDPADMQPGTYTITYKAGTGENEATATRTIIVSAPLSQLALEVRQNYLGESKWQGNLITFKNALYKELEEDTTLKTQSGVFHNNSDKEITLNVEGAFGCSAVLDKNGVVIEGRDGANNKLVNAENPVRAASSVTTMMVDGEEVEVKNVFAKLLKIPAGGYAVVIQNKYASEAGADFDGRGFMNYNVIYSVGNVVRLFWVDSGVAEGLLTPYVNQAPYFSGNGTIYAELGDTNFKLAEAAVAGLVAKDDNNTFELSDDVTLDAKTLSLTDEGGFDITKKGSYTITISATDGTNSATVTRKVEVRDDFVKLTVGDKTLKVLPEKYIRNQEVSTSSAAKYSMIVLDKSYTGAFATNSYGCAIVLDQYGTLLRIYDGANLGFYDKDGKVATTPFTTANYATYAWEQLAEGETLIVFPNDGGANETRKFGLSLRPVNGSHNYCGDICTLTGITFEEKQYTFTVGEKSFTAEADAYAFNDSSVTAKNVTSYRMIVYNKNYTGTVSLNGWGCAIVLDQYGTLTLVYDGANGGLYDKNGRAATTPFTTANYATYAWEQLAEGETLIVFPNVGGANEARAFGLSLRTDGSIGKTCTLTDVTFKDPSEQPAPVTTVTIKIGDNTFAKEGEITAQLNPDAKAATEYDFYIYTTAFSGQLGFTNGWGEAFVIGADNKIVRIYDGANGKYYDADNIDGIKNEEIMTAANYLEKALLSLKKGEYLLVAPNAGANLARQFLTSNKAIGATVEIAIPEVTITPSATDACALLANGKYFYNPVIVANAEVKTLAETDFVVYSYGYNGMVIKNGWSEIFVVDVTTGKVVTIYDGVNGKYYDAANASGVARTDEMYTLANMSLDAFEKLLPNQMMVMGLNGGRNSHAGRAFLVGNRALDKDMAIVGMTIATPATEAVSYAKITVGTKIWYQDATKIAVDNAYTGIPAFAIYHHGYTGTLISGGYGVAFVIDEASGKVVKIFDGTGGKYYDAETPNGATNAGCSAAGYITEAFAALEEGQYLLIAPNGGSEGNVARAFLHGSKKIDTVVAITLPQSDAE